MIKSLKRGDLMWLAGLVFIGLMVALLVSHLSNPVNDKADSKIHPLRYPFQKSDSEGWEVFRFDEGRCVYQDILGGEDPLVGDIKKWFEGNVMGDVDFVNYAPDVVVKAPGLTANFLRDKVVFNARGAQGWVQYSRRANAGDLALRAKIIGAK